eukprot:Nk52_evm32s288 gene=Nk52_evmTU32s288
MKLGGVLGPVKSLRRWGCEKSLTSQSRFCFGVDCIQRSYGTDTSLNEAFFYDTTIEEYASKPFHSISIGELIKQGENLDESKLIKSSRFIHEELPIRLALRIQELRQLPFIVGCNPHVRTVHSMYVDAFHRLRTFPEIFSLEGDKEYVELLKKLVSQHKIVISTLANASVEISQHMKREDLNSFLDNMLSTRISRRVLAEHHIALHESFHASKDGQGTSSDSAFVGIIMSDLNPKDITNRVIRQAQNICETYYCDYPEVQLHGNLNCTIAYIPHHLEYMLLELLKNAMRATVESHGIGNLPDVNITFSQGDKTLSVLIQDEGGGIPRNMLERVWDYSYTTVKKHGTDDGHLMPIMQRDGLAGGPIAGLGFGMPMTRVYANYFGGSVDLFSLDGYGCDVFLKMNNIEYAKETEIK